MTEPRAEREGLEGLPEDLARILRDPSILVPQDARVFELIAEWARAPSGTASALTVEDWQRAWSVTCKRLLAAETREEELRAALWQIANNVPEHEGETDTSYEDWARPFARRALLSPEKPSEPDLSSHWSALGRLALLPDLRPTPIGVSLGCAR